MKISDLVKAGISIVHCPFCGKKHRDDYCVQSDKVIPEDMMVIEVGFDEYDGDFENGF